MHEKGHAKSLRKTSCTPFVVSVYVVYYARIARTFYIGLAPVCVYTIIWIDQINSIKRCKEFGISLQRLHAICNHLYVHGRKVINFFGKCKDLA